MRDDDPLKRTIEDWEQLFTNAHFLRPVGHGGSSQLDREVQGWTASMLDDDERLEAYTKMVSAVLNRWKEIQQVATEPYMTDPILSVARMASRQDQQTRKEEVDMHLLQQLQRLWTESPRPHDKALRFLALNYGRYFPISRVEIWLLFQQPGWEIVALRSAGLNDSLTMIQDLHDCKADLSVSTIISFVDMGFPKTKAMKWLLLFHATKGSVELLRQEWEAELIAAGMTQEEIYRYEP